MIFAMWLFIPEAKSANTQLIFSCCSHSTQWSSEMKEEEEELLMFTIALSNKRKRSGYMRQMSVKKLKCGEYHHLVQEMDMNEEKFRQYLRLSPAQFIEVLSFMK